MAQVDWAKVNAVLSSESFKNASAVAGAGVSAYANSKAAQDANKISASNVKQNAAQFAAEMALRQQQQNESTRLSAATNAAAASPLGANEKFALQQGLLGSILPGLRNAKFTPSDPAIAAAKGPGMTGGLRLPEGGIPASALASLSPAATAGAISQRQQHITNIDPNAPGINLARMGFGPEALGPQQEADDYQSAAAGKQIAGQNSTAQQIQAALEQNYGMEEAAAKKKKGSSLLSKLGKVAKVAVPVVLAMTGVGIPAAAAITAATYAASKKADGGSWGDAAKAGITGGVTGAVGAGAIGGAAGGAAGAASGGSKVLSGVNAAAQWAPTAQAAAGAFAPQGQAAPTGPAPRVPSYQQPMPTGKPAAVDAQAIAAALRRGRF